MCRTKLYLPQFQCLLRQRQCFLQSIPPLEDEGKIAHGRERVEVVEPDVCLSQRQLALVLLDGRASLSESIEGGSERAANVRLHKRLIGEEQCDLGLGSLDRSSQGHIPTQPSMVPLWPSRRQDLILEKLEYSSRFFVMVLCLFGLFLRLLLRRHCPGFLPAGPYRQNR